MVQSGKKKHKSNDQVLLFEGENIGLHCTFHEHVSKCRKILHVYDYVVLKNERMRQNFSC